MRSESAGGELVVEQERLVKGMYDESVSVMDMDGTLVELAGSCTHHAGDEVAVPSGQFLLQLGWSCGIMSGVVITA